MEDTPRGLDSRFARLGRVLVLAVFVLAWTQRARALDPAPALNVQRLDGSSFSLDSLRGNVVVLDFWASWCVPCRTSFPLLDALQAKYEKRGLRVLGLTLEENEDAIRAFTETIAPRFPILRDPSGRAGEAFGVVAMPTTFLIDREGRIAARFEGGEKKAIAQLESAAASLLEGGPVAPETGVRVAKSLAATSGLKAWQRGYLADPFMNLSGDPLTRMLHEHIHASKEGAAGDGGPAGGGCGCN